MIDPIQEALEAHRQRMSEAATKVVVVRTIVPCQCGAPCFGHCSLCHARLRGAQCHGPYCECKEPLTR
jgi:hypothetical protein